MSTDTETMNQSKALQNASFWQRAANRLIDNGQITVAVLVMGAGLWICYRWIEEDNRQDEIDKINWEKRMESCENYSRAVLMEIVQRNTEAMEKNANNMEKLTDQLKRN